MIAHILLIDGEHWQKHVKQISYNVIQIQERLVLWPKVQSLGFSHTAHVLNSSYARLCTLSVCKKPSEFFTNYSIYIF